MINVTDRVPTQELSNGAIRYGIYDNQGNLLRYEYIKREDEPTNAGTPINKVLFDSIKDDFVMTNGKIERVDRYTIPTITSQNNNNYLQFDIDGIDEYFANQRLLFELPKTTEQISSNVIPTMTANEQDGFITKASSSRYNDEPYRATGNNAFWRSETPGNVIRDEWWEIKLPYMIKNATVSFAGSSTSGTLTLQGSENGRDWENIPTSSTTIEGTSGRIANITDNKFYSFFKVSGTSQTSTSMAVGFFRITDGEKTIYNEHNATYVTINNLGAKLVTGISWTHLLNEAIYTNNEFVIKKEQKNSYEINSGTITNNGIIPRIPGYDNIVYIVSPNSISAGTAVSCSVNQTTGVVSCAGTANYWTISY